jgi:hypothetical protein
MARKLRLVFERLLPEPLQRYERASGKTLTDNLEDPLASAEALGEALLELVITPLGERYPEVTRLKDPPHYKASEPLDEPDFIMDASWEAFLAEIDRRLDLSNVFEGMDVPGVNWLDDIEQLEWIAQGQPADGKTLLENLYRKYAPLSARAPASGAARLMRQRIENLFKLYAAPPVF